MGGIDREADSVGVALGSWARAGIGRDVEGVGEGGVRTHKVRRGFGLHAEGPGRRPVYEQGPRRVEQLTRFARGEAKGRSRSADGLIRWMDKDGWPWDGANTERGVEGMNEDKVKVCTGFCGLLRTNIG